MLTVSKFMKAFFASILAFIIFTAVYFFVFLILGFVAYFLLKLPVIGTIIDYLFFFRGDSPDIVLCLITASISYFVVMATQEKLLKDTFTRGVSFIAFGGILILLHVASLILNLVYGNSILQNVVFTISVYRSFLI